MTDPPVMPEDEDMVELRAQLMGEEIVTLQIPRDLYEKIMGYSQGRPAVSFRFNKHTP